jgi:hypothetical protein
MNPTRIPAGFRIVNIGGIPELVQEKSGPRYSGPQRVPPRATQPQARPAAPAPRPRASIIEERLARSALTPAGIEMLLELANDPALYLPSADYAQWKRNGWVK